MVKNVVYNIIQVCGNTKCKKEFSAQAMEGSEVVCPVCGTKHTISFDETLDIADKITLAKSVV